MKTKKIKSPFRQETLIADLKSQFSKIPDHRAGNKSITLEDVTTSLFSVFAMKLPSLLKFEEFKSTEKGHKSNLKSLFKIEKIPSDTQMRKIVDDIDPKYFLSLFKNFFRIAQRGGKLAEFEFMKIGGVKHYLVPIDGTEYASSKKIRCANCLSKKHRNGETTWSHQALIGVMADPEKKRVLPIGFEPITAQDGHKKQDCEYVASKRLLARLRKEHPKLGMIVCGDALYAKGDLVREFHQLGMSYILNVKEKGNPFLFRTVNELEEKGEVEECQHVDTIGDKVKKTRTRKFRFVNGVPLDNASSNDFLVNFLECWETLEWTDSKGKKQKETKHFSWVTDIKITERNALKIMTGGRCRWRVENETINTLKNQGYHFEHNYGHGDKYLSINSAILMALAFALDQLLELGNDLVQQTVKVVRKSYIRQEMRILYKYAHFETWEKLWRTVMTGELNTS